MFLRQRCRDAVSTGHLLSQLFVSPWPALTAMHIRWGRVDGSVPVRGRTAFPLRSAGSSLVLHHLFKCLNLNPLFESNALMPGCLFSDYWSRAHRRALHLDSLCWSRFLRGPGLGAWTIYLDFVPQFSYQQSGNSYSYLIRLLRRLYVWHLSLIKCLLLLFIIKLGFREMIHS